jgi:aryl sulfotransferase
MAVQPARREYRTWILDSRRWQHYRPRPDDIVVATYPKCGTTWVQQIVLLLIFRDAEPRSIPQVSPWIDRRFPAPIEAVIAAIEAQTHRRSLKSHLAADGLPLHEEVKYIHVARDGRDACMSYHHHILGFTPEALATMDRIGMEDEAIGRPYPRVPADAAEFFRMWISEAAVPGHEDGAPFFSFFDCERSWWQQRRNPNVLLVHYNDLKANTAAEMRRVADFLEIRVPGDAWAELVDAASFEAMRGNGERLMGPALSMFRGGAEHFFHKGTNGRWRDVLTEADLALYDAKVDQKLSGACAEWVANGRRAAGEPRSAPD